jgi:hypothetical protein
VRNPTQATRARASGLSQGRADVTEPVTTYANDPTGIELPHAVPMPRDPSNGGRYAAPNQRTGCPKIQKAPTGLVGLEQTKNQRRIGASEHRLAAKID